METKIEMTDTARYAARSLAIDYDAFNRAMKSGDRKNITLLGNSLIKSQQEVGVEIYKPHFIRNVIAGRYPC
jgi:hypothetical protein